MLWTDEHDELLCHEVLLIEPYQKKPSTRKRGQTWTTIAENHNSILKPKFNVSQRSVRERVALLEKRYRKKNNDEKAASRVEVDEQIQLEQALENIVGK